MPRRKNQKMGKKIEIFADDCQIAGENQTNERGSHD